MLAIVRTAIVAAFLMTCTSVGVVAFTPKPRPAAADFSLETLVPRTFGDWRVVPASAQVINPQTQELLDKLYSQLLTRTYVNARGESVMLSIAYGNDQRGGLQAHMPDVCYPAQGFNLVGAQENSSVAISGVSLPVRRLHARLGSRDEPITYWFTYGSQAIAAASPWEKRLIDFRFVLTGTVPDGLLVRVSSIESSAPRAYTRHDGFIRDLLSAMPIEARARLSGVAGG